MTSPPAPQPEEYLPKIKEHLASIQFNESTALKRAIDCGQVLASAKAALEEANARLPKSKQTSWGKWLKEHLDGVIKLSTANVYIRLYEHKDEVLKKARSISEARAVLPQERKRDPQPDADSESEAEEDSEDGGLSEEEREQIASEYLASYDAKTLYNHLTNICNEGELFELWQLLGQRFDKSTGPNTGAPATGVANQPAVAARRQFTGIPENKLT